MNILTSISVVAYLAFAAAVFHVLMREMQKMFEEGGPSMEMNWDLNYKKIFLLVFALSLIWPFTMVAGHIAHQKNKQGP